MAEAAVLLGNVVQTVLVARWLGPRSSGIAAVVLAYPAVIFAIFEPQSSQPTIRYLGEFTTRNEHARALTLVRLSYTVDGALGLVSFLAVVATATLAEGRIVRADGTASLLILYSAAFAVHASTSTSRSVLWSTSRFRVVAVERVVSSYLGVAVSLLLVQSGFGVPGVVWGGALGMVVDGVALTVLASTTARRWGGAWWSAPWSSLRGRYREIVRFIAYSNLDGLFGLIARRLDIVLLGALRGPTDVGFYRVARAIGSLPGHLIWPLEFTAYPRMAATKTAEGHDALMARARRYALLGGVPLALSLLATIPAVPFALPLVAGREYEPAVAATQVFLAGGAVWLGCFWLRPLVLTLGFVRFWALNSGAFVLASLLGFVWLTPRHGYLAMAWVYAVLQALQYLTALGFVMLRAAKQGSDEPGPDSSMLAEPATAPDPP